MTRLIKRVVFWLKPKFDMTPLGHENTNCREVPVLSAITITSKNILKHLKNSMIYTFEHKSSLALYVYI